MIKIIRKKLYLFSCTSQTCVLLFKEVRNAIHSLNDLSTKYELIYCRKLYALSS